MLQNLNRQSPFLKVPILTNRNRCNHSMYKGTQIQTYNTKLYPLYKLTITATLTVLIKISKIYNFILQTLSLEARSHSHRKTLQHYSIALVAGNQFFIIFLSTSQ